jgi:hypothetical protein
MTDECFRGALGDVDRKEWHRGQYHGKEDENKIDHNGIVNPKEDGTIHVNK